MEWTWFPIKLSFFIATIATVITFFVAVLFAHIMVTRRVRMKPLVETFFFLPLVLPPTVIGFMLVIVFGKNSPFGRFIEYIVGSSIMFTATAAVLASATVAFPLMYQSVKTGFISIDENIVGAAKVDGASTIKILLFISLPLSIRSITAGVILSFTRAFGEFGATLMFAGNIPEVTQTIPTVIYLAIESGNVNLAWKYVGISIFISFLLLFSINQTNRQN
ncbi:molybdate ABC transporter permease subunit [Aquibacillus salsiterrae]|uniref:Molybdenum transport system permease n=1 Tax=Aquibacillus salsiterrae TaxID=2950439 RepID=A0A9X4AH12_9BACI|nr:molybdate ABC transporter permease subunit [Aquibacillus salsiterrae]MDC3417850.1 molybdate ABC transporter permease subunit [Aquibacillus salsiterrae]